MTPKSGIALVLSLVLSACASNGAMPSYGASTTQSPLGPQGDRNMLNVAHHLAQSRNYTAAISIYRQALAQNYNRGEALLGLGQSLMAIGQYEQATLVLNQAHGADRNNAAILAALGKISLVYRDFPEALDYFDHSMRISRVNNELPLPAQYSGLAIAAAAGGDIVFASEILAEGLTHYPENLSLLNNSALMHMAAGDAQPAVETLEQIVILPQANMRHRQNLALAYILGDETQKAQRLLSVDHAPDDVQQKMRLFYSLRGQSGDRRILSFIFGLNDARHDREQLANARPADGDVSNAVARAIVVPSPPPVLVAENIEEEPIPRLIEPEGWAVQIAAYRHANELNPGWALLKERYAAIIGHLEPRRSEKDFGSADGRDPHGFFYRLNAGPLATFQEAQAICKQIAALDGDCWIRPPEITEGKLPLLGD